MQRADKNTWIEHSSFAKIEIKIGYFQLRSGLWSYLTHKVINSARKGQHRHLGWGLTFFCFITRSLDLILKQTNRKISKFPGYNLRLPKQVSEVTTP